MIYFVINNDFHEDNVLNHISYLKDEEICVIRIPYHLTSDCKKISGNVVSIETPFRKRSLFWNPYWFFKAKAEIKRVRFKKEDKVVLLTEYDPLNQFVAYCAKKAGARVILLEEGIATYYTCASNKSDDLSRMDIIKLGYLRFIVGFGFTNFFKRGTNIFPQISDRYIDAVCLYNDVKLSRNIPLVVVENPVSKLENLDEMSCVFLSQPLYESYSTKDEYFLFLQEVLNGLCRNFNTVYFKFHPREAKEISTEVKSLLDNLGGIKYVPIEMGLTEFVVEFKPGFAVSFFSDSLFKLYPMGIEPIFVFHLFSKLRKNPVLENISMVLNSLQYEYLIDLEDISRKNNMLSRASATSRFCDFIVS